MEQIAGLKTMETAEKSEKRPPRIWENSKVVAMSPFLVIKPGGMDYEDQIVNFLKNEGISIVQRYPIPDWNRLATGLYGPLQYEKVAYGILLEKALPLVEGRADGLLLILDTPQDPDILKTVKQHLRHLLPPFNVVIHHDNGVLMTSQGFVHTPDKDRWCDENTRYLPWKYLILPCSSRKMPVPSSSLNTALPHPQSNLFRHLSLFGWFGMTVNPS